MPISKHDKQALADLFIHLGVPLITAIQTVESWSGGATDSAEKRAEKMAKLLNVSVDFATRVTKKLEIRDSYTLENVRGKILRIAAPIITDYYIANGDMPDEETVESLIPLFDVLLSFADSVSPTDEKGPKPAKIAAMVEACAPLAAAIRDNDFDMGESTVFKESVAGLKGRAKQSGNALGVDNPIEDGLFRAILKIYVGCYKQAAEQGGEIADVWRECDQRLALIHGLAGFVAESTGIEKPVLKDIDADVDEVKVAVKPKSVNNSKDKDKRTVKSAESADNATQSDSDSDDKGAEDGDEDDDFNPMSFFSAGG